METRKINYFQISEKKIQEIEQSNTKPSILLHVCCGPCSCFPLLYLTPHFDVTIYFNNSNIYPEKEYNQIPILI